MARGEVWRLVPRPDIRTRTYRRSLAGEVVIQRAISGGTVHVLHRRNGVSPADSLHPECDRGQPHGGTMRRGADAGREHVLAARQLPAQAMRCAAAERPPVEIPGHGHARPARWPVRRAARPAPPVQASDSLVRPSNHPRVAHSSSRRGAPLQAGGVPIEHARCDIAAMHRGELWRCDAAHAAGAAVGITPYRRIHRRW
jgi:hypothetical protein